jgi:hypothetical protein
MFQRQIDKNLFHITTLVFKDVGSPSNVPENVASCFFPVLNLFPGCFWVFSNQGTTQANAAAGIPTATICVMVSRMTRSDKRPCSFGGSKQWGSVLPTLLGHCKGFEFAS